MAAPTRKSSLPSHYPTQLSVISEEASQYGIDVIVSRSTSPIPPVPTEATPVRPHAPEPPDMPSAPHSPAPTTTATITTTITATPTSSKRSKKKAFIAAIRKHSSEFIESFKAHDFSKHRQEMYDVFALIYGTGAMTSSQQKKITILRIRKLQERGVEWWTAVTRAAQHKIDPPTDSLEDLLYAIKRGEDAVLKSQEFDKRLRGRLIVEPALVAYEADSAEMAARCGGDGVGTVREEDCVYFCCEIHAADAKDFHDAESECKQLVVEAGGTVLEGYDFIGGFMYSLPADANMTNPLANGDETLLGGHICIRPWAPFSPPEDHSANVDDEELVNELPGSDPDSAKDWSRVRPTASKRKMQNWILQQRAKADEAAAAAEAKRAQEVDFDEGEIVLSPRILDPGVELAILDPTRLWDSRPSSVHLAVQAVGCESREQQQQQELERSWLDISPGGSEEDGQAESVAESDWEYDEDAVVLEAKTAVRVCASPVFLRRAGRE